MPRLQNKKLTSRLSAHLGIQHIHTLDRLDNLGDGIATEIDRLIARIISWVHVRGDINAVLAQAHFLLSKLPDIVAEKLHVALRRTGMNAAQAVANALTNTLPVEYLPRVGEAKGFSGLTVSAGKIKPLTFTKDEFKRRVKNLLIEPLAKSVVEKIVLGGSAAVQQLKQQMTLSYDPRRLVQILSKGISDGKNRIELATDLRNGLGVARSTAKRIARTEGARVATESNIAAYEELGDGVIGFMVHSVLDERTRPWHRQRNGKIYYKEPKGDQKGLFQMPRPPREPQDANERPAGTSPIAFNCRCFLSPVFAPLKDMPELSRDAQDKIIPDPLTYDEWFKQAPERLKRKAVGSRRYDLVSDLHGKNASYFHFIEPDTGDLIDLDELRSEDTSDTVVRVMQGRQMANAAQIQRREILTAGSL